jgi:DNA-binding NtrC family response regulator
MRLASDLKVARVTGHMLAHFQQLAGDMSVAPPRTGTRDNPRDAEKATPARVLVVDDEALIRWSIAETLRAASFEVHEAGDGREALAVVRDNRPFDLILLDYRLPDSNDLALLAALRQLAPATPVVMMTAFGTPEVMRGALDAGAAEVISKPFEMGEIASIAARTHCG